MRSTAGRARSRRASAGRSASTWCAPPGASTSWSTRTWRRPRASMRSSAARTSRSSRCSRSAAPAGARVPHRQDPALPARGLPARRRRHVGDRVPLRAARLRLRAQPAGQARGDGLGCGQRGARRDGGRGQARAAPHRGGGSDHVSPLRRPLLPAPGLRDPGAAARRCARPAQPGARSAARSSRRYGAIYGHVLPELEIDVVSWRVVAEGPVPALRAPTVETRGGARQRAQGPSRRLHARVSKASPRCRCTTATGSRPAMPSTGPRSSRSENPRCPGTGRPRLGRRRLNLIADLT